MTLKVVINHDEKILEHAYGIDVDKFPKKLSSTIKEYFESSDEKMSSLGDILQNNLEPNEILYLAQLQVVNKLEQIEKDLDTMNGLTKSLGL